MSSTTPIFKARLATAAIFLVNGILSGNWIARIPSIKERLVATPAQLGLALFGMPVGLLIGALSAAWLVSKFGDRKVVCLSAVLYCFFLPFLGLVPSTIFLFFLFVLMGMSAGILDVSMNIQAAAVEKKYDKPIMSSFHGVFSAGGLFGALIGGSVASQGIGVTEHLFFVGLGLSLLSMLVYPYFLPKVQGEKSPFFVKPNKSLLALGIIAFCVLMGEGAIGDWSGVYLRETLRTDIGFAALGYGIFSFLMAIGRFAGDSLTEKIGRTRITYSSGIIAGIGILLAIMTGNQFVALVGFGLVGIGFATIFPNLITAASQNTSMQQSYAIASVTTFGYVGFLMGPPVIGLLAEYLTLRGSLGILALLCLLIVILAKSVK